jgi:hypothetical protein
VANGGIGDAAMKASLIFSWMQIIEDALVPGAWEKGFDF